MNNQLTCCLSTWGACRMYVFFNSGISDLADNGSGTTNDASELSDGASEPAPDSMASEKVPQSTADRRISLLTLLLSED